VKNCHCSSTCYFERTSLDAAAAWSVRVGSDVQKLAILFVTFIKWLFWRLVRKRMCGRVGE